MSFKKSPHVLAMISAFAISAAFGEPTPIPTTGDAACAQAPTGTATDTVVSAMDSEGYYSLFNGTDLTGWFHSCQTSHSGGSAQGGIFRVSPENQAIYLMQRGTSTGGILMTKKKFEHYELVFDYWSDFNNDGGVFHRTPANGNCMQVVMDYINDASVGGVWGEGSNPPMSRDYRPWAYKGSETNIAIPGNGSGELSNWTTITSKLSPTTYGCAATGCVAADYYRLFDADGWNQFKMQFYGGITGGDKIRIKTWFRKVGATTWVPIIQDTNIVLSGNRAYPANFIGLQVHGGGRFGGAKGAWYRKLKWRELTATGEYAWQNPTSSLNEAKPNRFNYKLNTSDYGIEGSIDAEHEIQVTNAKGTVVAVFNGKAGAYRYPISKSHRGWLFVKVIANGKSATRKVFFQHF
jgi:Domain of Unknown Function (DUF1080)